MQFLSLIKFLIVKMSNNIYMSTPNGSTSNGNVINTTYNNLLNLIINNNLVLGAIYEFSYLLKFNMVGTLGEFTADNAEIIQVFALSSSTISNKAYSVTYNESLIYDINTTNSYAVSTVNSTGYISCRYLESANQFNSDYKNYNIGFDFRNQYFYKYETNTNLVGFTNVDNLTPFIKYQSFEDLEIINCKIGFAQNVEFALINSSYEEYNNTSYNYRNVISTNSKINIINDGFIKISIENSKIFATELNNIILTGKNIELENSIIFNSIINNFFWGIVKNKSEINNSSFNNLQFINLDNSVLETCTSTGNFTVNCINSNITLARDCYSLTFFENSGGVFQNNDIVKSTSKIRSLKFSSSGLEFTALIPTGLVVGVYDLFYLPANGWTVDDQFVGILNSPNANLGAVFNIGNNGTNNNLLINLAEVTIIVGNVNNNIATPIRINTGGLMNLQVLIANCNNPISFSYTMHGFN